MKILFSIGKKLHKFFSHGGWVTILILGFFGILFAIIGKYGTMGFNWKWFVFFDLPLYTFCGWALYNVGKLIIYNKDIFKIN